MRPHRASAFADAVPLDLRGRRTPATLDALDRRDALIVEAVAVHFAGASMNDAAHRLHAALARYEAGPWRRERIAEHCPSRHTGRLTAYCWNILAARAHTPSVRLIRSILARTAFRCQGARP